MVRLVMGGGKTRALLDDARHDEEIVFLRGRVGQRLGHGQARRQLVGAKLVFQVGLAEERDVRDIDLRELANVAENVAELFLERGDFFR